MTRTRIALALVALALLVAVPTGTAHAQYGTTTTTTVGSRIQVVTVVRGQLVDVSGVRCRPLTQVVVTFDDGTVLARLRSGADGAYVVSFKVPRHASLGRHLVTSRCRAEVTGSRAAGKIDLGSDGADEVDAEGYLRQYLWVDVTASEGATGSTRGALARTGSSNTGPLVGVGAGALVLGAAFVYGSRRPRSAAE